LSHRFGTLWIVRRRTRQSAATRVRVPLRFGDSLHGRLPLGRVARLLQSAATRVGAPGRWVPATSAAPTAATPNTAQPILGDQRRAALSLVRTVGASRSASFAPGADCTVTAGSIGTCREAAQAAVSGHALVSPPSGRPPRCRQTPRGWPPGRGPRRRRRAPLSVYQSFLGLGFAG
jgi:hypothetical protein